MTKKRDCMQRLYTGISDFHYSTNPNSFTRRSVYPLSYPERGRGWGWRYENLQNSIMEIWRFGGFCRFKFATSGL